MSNSGGGLSILYHRVSTTERGTVAELLEPVDGPPGIDVLRIPPGTLCVVNALAGEVWFSDRTPQRQWLVDVELEALERGADATR